MRMILSVLVLLCVAACEQSPLSPSSTDSAPAPPSPVPPTAVAWVNGDMEIVLEQARAAAKPVLLYWGTEWCPACTGLRATVFARADFVEASRAFVPIYLDGDKFGAERWRDALGLANDSTLLILRSDHGEITRLPSGLGLAEYASVLNNALRDGRAADHILSLASSGQLEVPISDHDCRRLASQGWDLYEKGERDPSDLAVNLTTAAARCSSSQPIAQARLSLFALSFALQSESQALERGQAASSALNERVRAAELLLHQPEPVRGSIDILIGLDTALYTVVRRQGRAFTDRFRESWTAAMLDATRDIGHGPSDRLLALAAAIDGMKQLRADHSVPNDLFQRADQDVDAALKAPRDREARGDIVDAACRVYLALGDDSAAYDLLTRELANTKTPYYYLSVLADLAERQGRVDEAVTWLGRAYLTAREQGPATSLRWGEGYVRGLIRLAPDEISRIRMATFDVIDALEATSGGEIRSNAGLTDLNKLLIEWAATPQRRRVLRQVEQRLDRAS